MPERADSNTSPRHASGAQAFAASPSVVFRQMDDGAVLLDLESGVYFGLDEVGTRVWTLLVEQKTPDAVCQVMLDEFDVDPGVLAEDVRRLVGELQQNGLLRTT
ncbi:MAG TPA: PqqD family protein [Vicinamibacterales bacterium]|jgi:hypothetical protein|nr:PqqD family protein [Vicinamibacterales bacterium]